MRRGGRSGRGHRICEIPVGVSYGPRGGGDRLRGVEVRDLAVLLAEHHLLARGVDLLQLGLGDAREGDAHRRVARGAVGAAEVHAVLAEGLVERVHGGEEPGAGLFLLRLEEVRRVRGTLEQAVQDCARSK